MIWEGGKEVREGGKAECNDASSLLHVAPDVRIFDSSPCLVGGSAEDTAIDWPSPYDDSKNPSNEWQTPHPGCSV
jgi:hypothetical protein